STVAATGCPPASRERFVSVTGSSILGATFEIVNAAAGPKPSGAMTSASLRVGAWRFGWCRACFRTRCRRSMWWTAWSTVRIGPRALESERDDELEAAAGVGPDDGLGQSRTVPKSVAQRHLLPCSRAIPIAFHLGSS